MARPFTLQLSARQFFFDRQVVLDRVQAGTRRALSRAGAFVRRRARSRLRRRKRVSRPGESPSVHAQDRIATLRNILFAWGPGSPSVVIGPVALHHVQSTRLPDGTAAVRGTVPELLEFGGTARLFEWDLTGRGDWTRADRRATRTFSRWQQQGILFQRTRVRVASYAPRPFMGPALQQAAQAGEIARGFQSLMRGG